MTRQDLLIQKYVEALCTISTSIQHQVDARLARPRHSMPALGAVRRGKAARSWG